MVQEHTDHATEAEQSLAKLDLNHTKPFPEELDPWQQSKPVPDLAGSSSSNPVVLRDDLPKDDELQINPFASGVATPMTSEEKEEHQKDILQEFDPLASQEEKAAREAWETAESHPQANAPASTSHPTIPPSASAPEPISPRPTSPTGFPALAALARTFAIPLVAGRQRPRSLDTAAAVPSPSTLSSFASQQQLPVKPDSEHPSPASTGRNTPVLSANRSKPQEVPGEPPQFDFQKFLDQMKLKAAEPVAKYLRSFLSNFAKRTFTVADQMKLINDFLNFIALRMRESDVWRNCSDVEFDNAMEGMEKLVMNRLYDFTFTPQVIRMVPPRPVTSDDLERDRVLSQRIALFTWIQPEHLDVPEGEGREGFMMFAQQELLKINHYKAPRDKLICILNCCKVIFGLIRHLRKEEGADNFVPILIYVVLKANPEHLLSNVEFINRFRNPAKLQSEAGYYLSSLMGAVSFIETMDHTSLSNITQEEFEKNVEDAIQSLPSTESETPTTEFPTSFNTAPLPHSHTGEESAQPLALSSPGNPTISEDARRFLQKTGDTISKPLSAIGRIFNEVLDNAEESLSHLPGPFAQFEQLTSMPHTPTPQHPLPDGQTVQTPYKPRVRKPNSPIPSPQSSRFGTPAPDETPTRHPGGGPIPYTNQPLSIGPSQQAPSNARLQPHGQGHTPRLSSLMLSDRDIAHLQHSASVSQSLSAPSTQSPHVSRTPTPNLDLAGLQAEIDRAHENAASAAKETLRQIFPTMDVEIVEWVLEANEGDLGKSIEALLEMSSGS
ncbi:hypothetical protein BXZ70DRAFT_1005506 [Cristinia sonorae]|uniref:Guanine nucleotide exchange factor Vps9 n=1 Tax=Cristinia sonorae TaxID=1940300 RepID=A0A8K0UUU5_9AGAR|nr:hypothetical protein BXZ70DRAFT_1005506 [Cristinia sonorae]